jgi:hypothetical protein
MTIQSNIVQAGTVWRPSNARRVALDGFSPVPRGGAGRAQSILIWPEKDPSDVLDYEIDIGPAILGNEGDAITAINITATPAATNDITITRVAADGDIVVVWISGGVAGTIYVVQVTISTANGRTLHRSILLPVQALAAATVPSSILTTNSGAIVTDQNGNPILLGS